MKLLVFPEARQGHVESIVRAALAKRGVPEDLTLSIVRTASEKGWSVQATGVGDALLEAGFCDVVEEALRDADI